jgi:hypothetical protein
MSRMETIAHVAFEYRVDGLGRIAYRGEKHDVSAWDDASVESAKEHGVFMAHEDEAAPAPSLDAMDVAALADWMTDNAPNQKATIALADGDPMKAAKVLDAENIVTGGSPRKGVFNALAALMNAND